MKEYCVIGFNECGEEFNVDTIKVNETGCDDITVEDLAYMVFEKRKEVYRERYNEEINVDNFILERKFSNMSYNELMIYGDF